MTRHIPVTCALVLGLAASPALGAVCGPDASPTLALTDTARIYSVPGGVGKPTQILGCTLETGGAPVRLGTKLTRRVKVGGRTIIQRLIVTQPRLNGTFAAIAVRNFDSLGRGKTTVRVVDLRTGVPAFVSTATKSAVGRARDWTVTDLEISRDGRAGWISRYRPDPAESGVWIHGPGGEQQIDTAVMDPTSLTIAEVLLEDGTLDVAVNYTKNGGTEAGNSGVG